jgi:AmmeMemoRadiSam system protein B
VGAAHVELADAPHRREHSLEVQLPFLQILLGRFALVPLAAGDATAQEVASVLERVWGDERTLIVVSSDLSHYLGYAAARRIDAATTQAILQYSTTIEGEQACGHVAINGLMQVARTRRLTVRLLDLRNSGDTAGQRSSVVGYAAFALYEAD